MAAEKFQAAQYFTEVIKKLDGILNTSGFYLTPEDFLTDSIFGDRKINQACIWLEFKSELDNEDSYSKEYRDLIRLFEGKFNEWNCKWLLAMTDDEKRWESIKNHPEIRTQAEYLRNWINEVKPKGRVLKDEFNKRAGEYLENHREATRSEIADAIGCSLGMISKLPAWKTHQGIFKKDRQVSLSCKIEETISDSGDLIRPKSEQSDIVVKKLIRKEDSSQD
ncbi:hypothetical protein ACFL54_06315 [Planctomycetota bacterium]